MALTGQLGTADAYLQNLELGGPIPLLPAGQYPIPIFELNFVDDPIACHRDAVLGCFPAAYWRLADTTATADDETGQGRTGTLTGGYTQGAAGALGDGTAATTFNGTSGYVDVPNYSNAFNLTANYSYSVWAYPTATRVATATDAACVLSYEYTGAGAGVNIPFALAYGREDTLGIIDNRFWCGYFNGTTWYKVVDPTSVVLSQWVHYVVTWDAAADQRKLVMYRNGVEVGFHNSASPVVAGLATGRTFIGRRWDTAASGTDEFFPGSIDDVAFFGRTLGPVEAATLYASGSVRRLKESGYVDYTPRLRGFRSRRGRQNNVDRVEAGELIVTLDNRDGALNPNPAAGVLPMRQARLRARYGRDIYPILKGFVESYRYTYPNGGADSLVELTISDGFRPLAGQALSGFSRAAEKPGPRVRAVLQSASIPADEQDVSDAYIYAANLAAAAPEVAAGVAAGVEVNVTRNGTLTNGSAIVTGLSTTSDLGPGLTVTGTGIPAGATIQSVDSGTQVTLTTAAQLSIIRGCRANAEHVQLSALQTTADLSVGMTVSLGNNSLGQAIAQAGATIAAIPTGTDVYMSLPANNVTIDNGGQVTGTFTRSPTTVALTFRGTIAPTPVASARTLPVTGALAHLRDIEQTELGLFFVSAANRYVYQGSTYRASLGVVATFNDNDLAAVPYTDLPISYDETNIGNEYITSNLFNQTAASLVNPASIRRYFPRSVTVSQLWENDFTLVNQRTEPLPRTDSLQLKPAADPARLWPLVLAREISDKVAVLRHPLGGQDVLAGYQQHIEGIAHEASPDGWTVTLNTSPVAIPGYVTPVFGPLRIDLATSPRDARRPHSRLRRPFPPLLP